MQKTQIKNSLLLLLTACIWGISFVAQSAGMDYIGPFTFNAVRCVLGGVSLLPVIAVMRRGELKRLAPGAAKPPLVSKTLLVGGVLCGICLCAASNFQQIGIQYTSVGKAGFITACYIVFVPLAGLLFGKKASPLLWGAVVLALGGLYLLCIKSVGEFVLNRGDLYMLACSVLFTLHILVIDHYSPLVDGVKMSCIQFFVCGLLSAVFMFIFEQPAFGAILQAWQPILYAGVMSCGVAYTLQIVGQKNMNPTVASLILSLEASVSVLAGWLLLGQKLTPRELAGCAVMFVAIVLAQLPRREKKKAA